MEQEIMTSVLIVWLIVVMKHQQLQMFFQASINVAILFRTEALWLKKSIYQVRDPEFVFDTFVQKMLDQIHNEKLGYLKTFLATFSNFIIIYYIVYLF